MVSLDVMRGWIRKTRTSQVDTTEDLLDGYAEILEDLERHDEDELQPCCKAIVRDISEDVADALRNAQD